MNAEDVVKLEDAAQREFRRKFGDQYHLALDALAVLGDGLSPLDGHTLSDQLAGVLIWLSVGHRNALGGALTMLSRGYFREAVTLIRSAFEDWGTQKYLAKHPEKAATYSEIDVKAPFKRKPSTPQFAAIWKELEGQGPEQAPRVYEWLCSYAHPGPPSLRSAYHRDAEGFWAHIAPHFAPNLSRQALAHWFQVAQLQLPATQELQALVLGSPDPDWSEGAKMLSSKVTEATTGLAGEILAHALDQIGDTLKRQGLSLEELIESGRQERGILAEEKYGIRAGPRED